MKKKISYTLLCTLLMTSLVPSTVLASGLPKITLEVPTLEIPDNMPDVSISLREKYDTALKGLEKEGFGENNYKNGLGDLELPEGFGSKAPSMQSAQSVFIEKYGNLWEEKEIDKEFALQHLEGKEEEQLEFEYKKDTKGESLTAKTLEAFDTLSEEEFDSYLDNIKTEYSDLFDKSSKTGIFETVSKEEHSFTLAEKVTSKWGDIIKKTSSAPSVALTEAEKQNLIENRVKPEGFDDVNTRIEDAKQERKTQIETKEREEEEKAANSFGKKIMDTANGFISDIMNGKTDTSSDVEKETYLEMFDNYYGSKKARNPEGTAQRDQIQEVLSSLGYKEKDYLSGILIDKEKIGKMIYDNKDVLEEKIPDLRDYSKDSSLEESYKEVFKEYFHNNTLGDSLSGERKEQRSEINQVLESLGYDMTKYGKVFSLDLSGVERGKLIYENLDVLKEKIPDLKAKE